MIYEWDPAKARTNLRNHGINFADAATVFSDNYALTILDDYPAEERFATIGMDALGRILVVVFTWRGQHIRIISAEKPKAMKGNNTKVALWITMILVQASVVLLIRCRTARRGLQFG